MNKFSIHELEHFRGISKSKKLVFVEGANFMGDRFKTFGFILTTGGYGDAYSFMDKDTFLLYQGQPAGRSAAVGQRRLNYLVLSPNFERRHGLCIEKILDEVGNIVYVNDKFDSLMTDLKWESKKLLGATEPALETAAIKLKQWIGKPIVVGGERTNLLAVSNVDSCDGNVVLCVGNGDGDEILVSRVDNIRLDQSAMDSLEKMAQKYASESSSFSG